MPLSVVALRELVPDDESWDLTMLRILPFVDGVNSVKQIALRADADYRLTRKAVKHLLYYGVAILLDVFQYGAIYAPTAEMAGFVEDEGAQRECALYVALPGEGGEPEREEISRTRVIELYLGLRQGLTVMNWYAEHEAELGDIDIRRFITFGVIKGFLYRVHKYAISPSAIKQVKVLNKKRGVFDRTKGKQNDKGKEGKRDLGEFLDGAHSFDEICTELMISDRDLMNRLKEWGDVQIIHR